MTLNQRKTLWQKEKEANQRERQENIDLALKGLNINGKEWESEDDESTESEAQCGFCSEMFSWNSILKHIGRNEACKIFCSGFENWKKGHKKIKMRHFRKEFGNKEELAQQRKRYASDPRVRENKRNYYEKLMKKQKLWRSMRSHQRKLKSSYIWQKQK